MEGREPPPPSYTLFTKIQPDEKNFLKNKFAKKGMFKLYCYVYGTMIFCGTLNFYLTRNNTHFFNRKFRTHQEFKDQIAENNKMSNDELTLFENIHLSEI